MNPTDLRYYLNRSDDSGLYARADAMGMAALKRGCDAIQPAMPVPPQAEGLIRESRHVG